MNAAIDWRSRGMIKIYKLVIHLVIISVKRSDRSPKSQVFYKAHQLRFYNIS